MPSTVCASFDSFRTNEFDLKPAQVEEASRSLDCVKAQIDSLAANDKLFPKLNGGYLPFGSFARQTKIHPLDAIDMLLLIDVNHQTSNSTRILNEIRRSLSVIASDQKAEIKQTGEAVSLKLKAYDWQFDIVPAVPINDHWGETDYYLIPDGAGKWQPTNSLDDQTQITKVNKTHDHFKPVVRLMKYWSRKYSDVPRIRSYYVERMLLEGFLKYPASTSIQESLRDAFQILSEKAITTDLPGLAWDTWPNVNAAAKQMIDHAEAAIRSENTGEHRTAITTWGKIFPNFPVYE